jgi:hypothetical protein
MQADPEAELRDRLLPGYLESIRENRRRGGGAEEGEVGAATLPAPAFRSVAAHPTGGVDLALELPTGGGGEGIGDAGSAVEPGEGPFPDLTREARHLGAAHQESTVFRGSRVKQGLEAGLQGGAGAPAGRRQSRETPPKLLAREAFRRRQTRQKEVADAVAGSAEVPVGGVPERWDPQGVVALDGRAGLDKVFPGDLQKRSHDAPSSRLDASEARQSAAEAPAQEDGFRLVVPMVGRHDPASSPLPTNLFEEGVAESSGAFFQALPGLEVSIGPPSPGGPGNPQSLGHLPSLLGAARRAGVQVVVVVGGEKAPASAEAECGEPMEQGRGVGATGKGDH